VHTVEFATRFIKPCQGLLVNGHGEMGNQPPCLCANGTGVSGVTGSTEERWEMGVVCTRVCLCRCLCVEFVDLNVPVRRQCSVQRGLLGSRRGCREGVARLCTSVPHDCACFCEVFWAR